MTFMRGQEQNNQYFIDIHQYDHVSTLITLTLITKFYSWW